MIMGNYIICDAIDCIQMHLVAISLSYNKNE